MDVAADVVVDAANNGNIAADQSVQAVDMKAPNAPTFNINDSGSSGSDNITNVNTITVSGLEIDASWEYSFDGGISWHVGIGTTFDMVDDTIYDTNKIQVRQIDLAGNVSWITTNAAVITEDSTNPNAPTFSINDSGVSNTDNITNVNTITLNGIEAGASWQYSLDVGNSWNTGSGTTFDMEDNTTYGVDKIQVCQTDLAGNTSEANGNTVIIKEDSAAPFVSGVALQVTGDQNNTLNAGDTFTVIVTMSESVTVTGASTIGINIGSTTVQAEYLSGNGTDEIRYSYTVQSGDNDNDGIFIVANSLTGTLADMAGNPATLTHAEADYNYLYVDTTAPTATILDDDVTYSNSDMTFTFQFSEAVSGFDFSDIMVNAGTTDSSKFTKIDDDTYMLVVHSLDNGTNGEITVDITTGSFADMAGNINAIDILADTQAYTATGSSVIDLGSYGKLIAPIFIDNDGDGVADSWFYHWDRSGDGTSANTGSLNGGVDYTTHDVLDSIFKYDINGTEGGGGNTDNIYRYATINGIDLALATTGTGNITETSTYYLSDNQSYSDLSEVWDNKNIGYQTNGVPTGWQDMYWTSTPSTYPMGLSHSSVILSDGRIYYSMNDHSGGPYVALQVL